MVPLTFPLAALELYYKCNHYTVLNVPHLVVILILKIKDKLIKDAMYSSNVG